MSVAGISQPAHRRVLVTGAGGLVGSQLIAALARERRDLECVIASDVRAPSEQLAGVEYAHADVRQSEAILDLCRRHQIDLVVHLAAIVTPGPDSTRELEYAVDVVGTRNVLAACLATGVRKLIYTSSGAAYGYHADNPASLDEDAALRGNPEFAYSHHKRLVEEILARARVEHPELQQLVFRPGVILGQRAHNQITELFEGRCVLGLAGAQSPFVIVWDEDVVGAILHGIHGAGAGTYNLAGDGTLSLREMARMLGKPYVALPPVLVTAALWILRRLGLSRYGPEQVRFLRHRPVLANRRLVQVFGYRPRLSTREAFERFVASRHASSVAASS